MIIKIQINDDEPFSIRKGVRSDSAATMSNAILEEVKGKTVNKFIVTLPGGGELINLKGYLTMSDISTALREKLY